MKLKTFAYAAFIAFAAGAFVVGSSGPSEAKGKKAMEPPPHPGPCFELYAPVCGVKGGMKFTYGNACFAGKDGAKIVSQGACPKAKPHKKHKAHKKMSKPAKKMEMKSDMKKPAAPAKDDKKK
ncbi:MAG TPA: Kazal-type serine protease inhibitor [Pseudolabrys sp.]|nr:Kazal-type serine protease inhibitor [Pseudolabrys sp.]